MHLARSATESWDSMLLNKSAKCSLSDKSSHSSRSETNSPRAGSHEGAAGARVPARAREGRARAWCTTGMSPDVSPRDRTYGQDGKDRTGRTGRDGHRTDRTGRTGRDGQDGQDGTDGTDGCRAREVSSAAAAMTVAAATLSFVSARTGGCNPVQVQGARRTITTRLDLSGNRAEARRELAPHTLVGN